MDTPVVLWADLTVNGSSAELRKIFAKRCRIQLSAIGDDSDSSIRTNPPNFACLEYDFPDRRGLTMLRDLKHRCPSVPLIMITLAHSEALAVWAFRAGAWDYLTKPVDPADVERIAARMRSLLSAREHNSKRRPAIVESDPPAETQYRARTGSSDSIAAAVPFIQTHLGGKITEKKVADECGMTTFRFSRAFHEHHGITFREMLLRLRIDRSKRLLLNSQLSVTQVAFMSGFSDASHFGKMFRRVCGRTPTDYRQMLAARLAQAESSSAQTPVTSDSGIHPALRPFPPS